MDKIPVSLVGKVIRFEKDKIIAVIKTEDGEVMLDINCEFDTRLKIGDEVEVEDASFYIDNGRIFTVVTNEIVINNVYMKLRRG
jgi:uncharacterized OB-fold protein